MLPRSEPVYHELLSRPGVERRYRDEALAGLGRGQRASGRGRSCLRRSSASTACLEAAQRSRRSRADARWRPRSGRWPAPERTGAPRPRRPQRHRPPGRVGRADEGRRRGRAGMAAGIHVGARSGRPAGRRRRWSTTRRLNRALYPTSWRRLRGKHEAPAAQTAARVWADTCASCCPGATARSAWPKWRSRAVARTSRARAQPSQSSSIPGGDFGGSARQSDRRQHRRRAGRRGRGVHDARARSVVGARSGRRAADRHARRSGPTCADGAGEHAASCTSRCSTARARRSFTARRAVDGVAVHTVRVGGDFSPALRRSAIEALPSSARSRRARPCRCWRRWREKDRIRPAAIDALSRIPRDRWPASELAPTAESLLAYARQMPAADRTGAEFKQVVSLGRELAARLPRQTARGYRPRSTRWPCARSASRPCSRR